MKALVLGDIHGEWFQANKVISRALRRESGITHIIQVGDLGDGWDDQPRSRWKPVGDLPIHWLDGNHENFDKIDAGDFNESPLLIYQPRGSVLEIDGYRMMFMGGAHSVDVAHRVIGWTWWPQEDITHEQLVEAYYQEGPFDAIFSHDRPESFPFPEFWKENKKGLDNKMALEELYKKFKPRFWFHGHYHWGWHFTYEDTEVVGCPIIESGSYTLWDGETVETRWISNPYRWTLHG